MDAALAILFFVSGFTDMALTDCTTSCLNHTQPPARLSFQVTALEHRDNWENREVLLTYDAPMQHGPFQRTYSIGVTATDDIWIGAGVKYTIQPLIPGPLFVETAFQPGLHLHGNGPNIGGALHFRSAIGIGYAFDNGATLAISYDHRSNADRTIPNPGLDTFGIRYAIGFN